MREYKPSPENERILERAMAHLKSVPYRVSLRWLFYRLFQDGIYKKAYIDAEGKLHDDYKRKWIPLCSDARKRSYGGWHPAIIKDDTRWGLYRVGPFQDKNHIKENLVEWVNRFELSFDHFFSQREYVIILFEAKAMIEQFMEYAKGISLFPFGGDASIPFKWDIAKHLEKRFRLYGRTKWLRVLYFGDHDDKGKKIYTAGIKDIQEWCEYEIQFTHCGLNAEQVERYGIEADEEGKFQWEALDDPQAREIIEGAMALAEVDVDLIKARAEASQKVTEQWRKKIKEAIEPVVERWKPRGK